MISVIKAKREEKKKEKNSQGICYDVFIYKNPKKARNAKKKKKKKASRKKHQDCGIKYIVRNQLLAPASIFPGQ